MKLIDSVTKESYNMKLFSISASLLRIQVTRRNLFQMINSHQLS